MSSTGLRAKMIANTISNYGKLVIGMVMTIFLTRLLFMGLTPESYGFWALLWTIFGYSLLLDFGFGAAIQKSTSENIATQDWYSYNRLISTVFFNYSGLAILIVIATYIMSFFLGELFKFQAGADLEYYKAVFLMFGIGTAIVFPTGFVTEILRGLHEIKLRNYIQLTFMILNFALIFAAFHLGYKLKVITIITLSTSFARNITMGYFCFKKMPELRIGIKYYDIKGIKKVMEFSIFAYIITFTNLIIFRTDQMVISIFASVALVSVYQIASRLAETFRSFSSQFLDNLSPIAATLFASNETSKLGKILIESNRLLGFIATMFLIPLIIYVRPLLDIWLEMNLNPGAEQGYTCALILLVSMYILVFLRSSSVYILLMGNVHRELTLIAVLECLANLGISILLVNRIGIIGVALGTIIPNAIFAVVYNIPKACRFAEIKLKDFIGQAVIRTFIVGVFIAGVTWGISQLHKPKSFIQLLLHLSLSCGLYLITYYFIGLHGWERKQLKEFVNKKIRKK